MHRVSARILGLAVSVRIALGVSLVLAAALAIAACQPQPAPREAAAVERVDALPARAQAACANRDPQRQAFFGDLHVHTELSMDAYMFQTRVGPDDAYRFARGEAVKLAPLDAKGRPTRSVRLERPLDFAAVTDHASSFGAVRLCSSPASPVYDAPECAAYRAPLDLSQGERSLGDIVRRIITGTQDQLTSAAVCGEDGARCRLAASAVWQETRNAAERWNDVTSECRFATLVAYEYTATPELTKIHRNVIFRNASVPELPISYADEPDVIAMWRRLRAECNDAGTGCDALAIPHNSNLSNGHMFTVDYGAAQGREAQAEVAQLRADMEPVVEMMQMKGDSECRNGMWNVLGGVDELCEFEKMRPSTTKDCVDGTGQGALVGEGCVSRLDFARYALVEGLREADRIGVNPYAFGMIAATDGHDGTPGAVEEWRQDLAVGRTNPSPGRNPGGLAGVWAEENSREAIFQALRRKETFGTSGPRLRVRFFGGWDYADGMCGEAGWVERAYARGVPMGGDLPPPAGDSGGPTFVVSAMRDPGTAEHPGGLLARVQIIKGWLGKGGRFHQEVIDVAGSADDGASVDAATCAPAGEGHETLCGVWKDPYFDPAQRAVYYARVVENPSCSQTGWACATAPKDDAPAWCAYPQEPIQERAWSSPIWYAPAG